MVQVSNGEYVFIDLWEWIALPLYIFFILLLAYFHQKKKIKDNPMYRFYTWGLLVKLLCSIFFVLIYYYYYGNGDTFDYYASSLNMKRLLFESPASWLRVEFGAISTANYSLFTPTTGYPYYGMYNDSQTFTVIRLINFLLIPGFSSYLLSTLLVAWLAYTGIWKLFTIFAEYYPAIQNKLAIAVLFFPSVIFWGSGILKDTITLSFSGWAVYCIYKIFIVKEKQVKYTIILLITMFLTLLIKPYIIVALLPGALVWIFSKEIGRIRNAAAKVLIIPFIVVMCGGLFYAVFSSLGNYMGKFAINNLSSTLTITSNDLKQSYYNGHAFDIGDVNNTSSGYIQKFPAAFIAGTYRPFIWEAGNVVMLLSGLENLLLLYLTFLMFRRTNPIKLLKRLFREPLLFFAFSYSVFFAFAVGISTSNFGALVRFKIAYLPFFVATLFILSQKQEEEVIEEEDFHPSIAFPS